MVPAQVARPVAAPRIRVLHLIQNLHYGGMERLVADIVRQIDAQRFESHIVTLQYVGPFGEGLSEVARVARAEPQSWYSMVWPAALSRQIRAIRPDVVHTHSGVWYKASLAARRAGVPRLVHTDHGRAKPDPVVDRVLDGIAARWTDVAVAVSEPLGAYLVRQRIVPRAKLRVVRNGVDTNRYRPREDVCTRGTLGIAPDRPIIGCIGRLEWIKGPDVLLEAFRLGRDRWPTPPPVLVLVGDGSLRPELTTFIERHGLADDVKLLGWREDIEDLLASLTLFTMGSRSEGTSVSLLEAMSTGLCPVVTDVGGNAGVLGQGLEHRLVPPENPSALAQAWVDALQAPDRVAADGIASRARVEAEFSLARMVREYERIYVNDVSR